MRSLFLAVLLSGSLARANELAEVFLDKGDTFMRAGTNVGLEVGAVVTIFGDKIASTEERRRVGTGTVMEVWPSLARLALDDAAKNDKSAKKYAAAEGAPRPTAARPKPPPPPPGANGPAQPQPAARGSLTGHATFKGAGPWKLLALYNDEDRAWTQCTLTLTDSRTYRLPKLKARDRESIALSNFKWPGPESDVDNHAVTVVCAEGQNRFKFGDD